MGTFIVDPTIPPAFPLIVGDIVHNLRTALDVTLCDIAILKNCGTNRIYFPLPNGPNHLEAILAGDLAPIRAEVELVLIDILNDEKKNTILRVLHELDVADKHTRVLPQTYQYWIGEPYGIAWEGNPDIPIKIFCHFGPPIGGPVVPTLKGLAELVESLVKVFATRCGHGDGVAQGAPLLDDIPIEFRRRGPFDGIGPVNFTINS